MGLCGSSNIVPMIQANKIRKEDVVKPNVNLNSNVNVTVNAHQLKKISFDASFVKSSNDLVKTKMGTTIQQGHVLLDSNDQQEDDQLNHKFTRKEKKSLSMIDKYKFGSKIVAKELQLCVDTQILVEEAKGMPKNKYKIIKKLGDGAYGTVFLVRNDKTKCLHAMKKIRKVKENEIDDMEIHNEIDILKKLDHPNIVKIFEFYDSPEAYYLITEYCKEGELYSKVTLHFNEMQIAVIFFQVFSGLWYLHMHNIVHRDLKLENILINDIEIDSNGDKYYNIKIIDFGTAKIFEKNKSEKAIVGSSYYIAPEVLSKKYNEKCDMWSSGVILYMLLAGFAPFDGANDTEIIQNIRTGEYDTDAPSFLKGSIEVQDLISKLLEKHSHKRLSAKDALAHPWFDKIGVKGFFTNIEGEIMEKYLNNLINFTVRSKFHQLVLAFLVHNLKDCQEKKDILKIFRLFNTSCDGKLTKNEIYEGLCKFKTQNEVKMLIDDIFMSLDGDNNQYVEFEEFLRACIDRETLLSDEMLFYAFNFFDRDNSKKISIDEIKVHFTSMKDDTNEDVFQNIIKDVDANGDGEIDFDEFKAMMLSIN